VEVVYLYPHLFRCKNILCHNNSYCNVSRFTLHSRALFIDFPVFLTLRCLRIRAESVTAHESVRCSELWGSGLVAERREVERWEGERRLRRGLKDRKVS
jgi:hypothetical protein